MNCFAEYENGRLIAVSTGSGTHPITEDEYRSLLSEIQEKTSLVDRLYSHEIAETDIPAEWREEIVRRVNERIETESAYEEEEATAEDIAAALEGLL